MNFTSCDTLYRNTCASLTFSAGTKTLHRHKFILKSGADLIEQEKIVFNISISITVKHLGESQPLGLYLGWLLPAWRLSAESAEIAQLGKVLVIYQC